MKFLTSIKFAIHLQQMMLIAPFHVVNNRVVPSAWLTVYLIFSIFAYSGSILIAINIIRTDGSLKLLNFDNGYLWAIIVFFELIFATVSYPILVIHTLFTRSHHMNFLNSISDIDEILQHQLGIDTGRVNSGKRSRSYIFIAASSTYFWSLWYLVFFHMLPPTYVSKKGIVLLLLANQAEQGSMGLLTLTIMNYCNFIRLRFNLLQSVNIADILRLGDAKKRRESIAHWLTTFRDLCELIEKMNTGWGFVIAWRYAHDFTLLISQLYLMYWIADRGGQGVIFAFIAYWSLQNIVKLVGLGYSASLATQKAYECGAMAIKFNTQGIDRVAKQMLDSFGVWMFHRKIQFTANNLFTVDLTLVYAIFGALASYLLILIQFKQQEDSIMAHKTLNGTSSTI